ncbi:uncharacterized protein LOC124370618 [Homalodisca vitripennis]|uniref:uncharacterized protein LOC124370618 n=1 Tax=Homalodisca vitripennis TaxID=197043 RepID=UPI001EEBC990|nr:uncharacterized protein LOC124370618 [Homalodisca vitripennis]
MLEQCKQRASFAFVLVENRRATITNARCSMLGGCLGSVNGALYVSTWFAYKLFAFLKEKDTPTNTLDTESVFVEQPENDPDEDEEEESNQSEPVVPSGNQSTATASPALTSSQNRFVPPQPKKRRRTAIDDPRLAQAYKIMDNATKTTRDECSTFGEHIATKLRKFDDRNRNYLMHKISTLIYETEIEVDTVYTRSPMQQSGESSASRMSTPSPQLPLQQVYSPPANNPIQTFINGFVDNNSEVLTTL